MTTDQMTEFVSTVQLMRTAQKEYFKTRDRAVLGQSKGLERKVDALLAQIKCGQVPVQAALNLEAE